MSSDEALASRAKRLSAWQADRAALLGQADAFVVVSWWQETSSDGRTGDYEYEHRPTLNDALDTYREYEDGEFRRARAVGIFAVKDGLPIGGRLEAMQIMRLMRETRRATLPSGGPERRPVDAQASRPKWRTICRSRGRSPR